MFLIKFFAFFYVALSIRVAIVDGFGSAEANQKLDADFARKALCNRLVQKYSCANGIIFVPTEEFRLDFTLTVRSIESDTEFILSPKNSRLTVQR